MNELPFSTAANRAAGVMKSIPGVGEPIYQGAYKLGQGLANLTSRVTPFQQMARTGFTRRRPRAIGGILTGLE